MGIRLTRSGSSNEGSGRRLREVAGLFLKLGVVAFGGPAAHIALMEDEVVTRRRWMSRQHFLDLVGATNLIPGPNSTEMTMHCGRERAGIAGLFVGGLAFILPAVVITGLLAHLYVAYGQLPAVERYLFGVKPVILVIILGAVYKLGRTAVASLELALVGLAALAATLAGLSEVLAVVAAGAAVGLWRAAGRLAAPGRASGLAVLGAIPAAGQALTAMGSPLTLFLVMLKIGAVLFGSGYVLVAYLDGELVQKLAWLTREELLDAVAVGQFTPGPVLSTATFVGYQIDGLRGAALATTGIFLPSFVFVLLLNPLVPRLRRSPWAAAVLDGVNVGAVAVMLAVTIELGVDLLAEWRAWLIVLAAAAALILRRTLHPAWLVAGGAALGALLA